MPLKQRTRLARQLRRNATDAEKLFWRALRESFPGSRFRRQQPLGRHILDFALPAAKLAIEIDGGQHALQETADAERTAEIARRGYRMLRFWNGDVLQNMPGVLEAIRREIRGDRPAMP